MIYPSVMSERGTLDLVLEGRSLARYGDGEFNLCANRPAKAQRVDPVLRSKLQILLAGAGDCLIGIPNVYSETPKRPFWDQQAELAVKFLTPGYRYASAFISRPDSAPWINTPDYWQALERLWVGQDVTLVTGGRHGLSKADLVGARLVREIVGPSRDAWTDYDELVEMIGTPSRALLCLGPTATVLAADLSRKGVHAVDLGHTGLFIRKYRAGQPMTVTDEDKAA